MDLTAKEECAMRWFNTFIYVSFSLMVSLALVAGGVASAMTGNADGPREVVMSSRIAIVPDDDDDLVNLLNLTDNDGTDSDGIDTPTPTDNDGTDSDGVDTSTPATNDSVNSGEPQKIVPIPQLLTVRSSGSSDASPNLVSLATQKSTTLALNNDPTPIFDAEAGYRILTSYGNATEINLSDFLSAGTTGVTFTLKSCDGWRADYYSSAIVENGKLILTSNDLGHVHGPNTQSETVCTVTGTGENGSEDREFRLYTVSDRTPPSLAFGALSLEEARETELDVRVNMSG